jgi:hypothetical protein
MINSSRASLTGVLCDITCPTYSSYPWTACTGLTARLLPFPRLGPRSYVATAVHPSAIKDPPSANSTTVHCTSSTHEAAALAAALALPVAPHVPTAFPLASALHASTGRCCTTLSFARASGGCYGCTDCRCACCCRGSWCTPHVWRLLLLLLLLWWWLKLLLLLLLWWWLLLLLWWLLLLLWWLLLLILLLRRCLLVLLLRLLVLLLRLLVLLLRLLVLLLWLLVLLLLLRGRLLVLLLRRLLILLLWWCLLLLLRW